MKNTISGAGLNCRIQIRGGIPKLVTCERSGPYCNVCEHAPGIKHRTTPIHTKLKTRIRKGAFDHVQFVRRNKCLT